MFNFLLQTQHNGKFNVLHRIKETKVIDNYTFEAMYLGGNASFHIATKCVKKDTYLKAMQFANISQKKLVFAEDILISTAILGVSKKIALLDSALYYYSYNNSSITRINHNEQTKIKIENLRFVISQLEQLAYKRDKYYKIFVLTLCQMLEGHIISNQMSPLLESYHRRIAKGYPRFIARPILSLQKKYFKRIKKKQDKKLSNFINNNKHIFESVINPH